MNTNIDYYEILEVHTKASNEVIKKAYQTLAKKYHPDTTLLEKNQALKKMTLLNEPISILSDNKSRSEYDSLLKQKIQNKFSNSKQENLSKKYILDLYYEKYLLIIKKHTHSFITFVKNIYSCKYYILLVLASSLFVYATVNSHKTSSSLKEKPPINHDFINNNKPQFSKKIIQSKPAPDKVKNLIEEDLRYNYPNISQLNSIKKSDMEKTKNILTTKGIIAEVLATTLGNNTSGTLVLVKKDNQTKFIVIDNLNNAIAEIPYSKELYDIGQTNKEAIVFKMTIFNDVKGNDAFNGAWKGKDHILPIYALYTTNSLMEITPGMLTTGEGEFPSNFQTYLQETKNVNLANLVLTEMKALR